MTLDELESLIRGSGPDSIELHDKVGRDLGSAAVALFATHDQPTGVQLELAGSGTLVSEGDSYWILTAAHVWEKKLKSASKLGITLRKGVDHHFLIEIEAIASRGFSQKGGEEEWGPDLCLLRIPSVYVSTIEANKASFNWGFDRQLSQGIDCLEAHFLLGCPADLGQFSQAHASVTIDCFLVNQVCTHVRNGFDYLDVDAYVYDASKIKSFRGVSGGGLWNVKFYVDPVKNEPAWIWSLEGVAFYQFPIVGASAIIRCHGPNTINLGISEP